MMNNQQNPYNQQPQYTPMMPPPMPRQRGSRRSAWQQRLFGNTNARPLTLRQERTIPDWLVGKSVLFFFIAFAACTFAFGYPMEIRYAIISSLSVLLFFYGSKAISDGAVLQNEKVFLRNVVIMGFIARLLWAFYGYFFFNMEYYGHIYGDAADTGWYMDYGKAIAQWVRDGFPVPFETIMKSNDANIDDTGYPVWLAIIDIVTFGESDVVAPFVIKCIIGAYCSVSIYHIAIRHFGEGVARMAALFVALNPNMIYWCGTMFKEVEMVFLCCLCVDFADSVFSSYQKLTFKGLLPAVLIGSYLFFFRAPLAIVIFMAMFAHIVMVSGKVMSVGKKIIAGILVAVTLFIGMGDQIMSQAGDLLERAQSDSQAINMEWRTRREGGNEFAKYAGTAVFAPLIFTIPFPTFNLALDGQILQRQLSGGNYIKNVCSYFVIWVMFIMLLSGEWRRHVFILAYTLGYLMTLVMSEFAQSGRFHMPIWPMLMLFAAYGIQLAKGNEYKKMRKWYLGALVVEVVACLAWNWFKLAGRGMI